MASLIDQYSDLVGKSELNFFVPPPTQIAAEKSSWHIVYPRDTVSTGYSTAPIVFHVSGLPDFLDLRSNYIKAKFQILKADGTNIDAATEVAPINYIGNTFINQLKISIGNKLVFDSQDSYHYRSYIEALLNNSTAVKDTQLAVAGWYTNQHTDANKSIDQTLNTGYIGRQDISKESRIFEVFAPLHGDIFNQSLYMLPNIDLRIELYRNPDDFTLVQYPAGEGLDFRLHLREINLHLRRVEVNKNLSLTIEKMLLKDYAKFPIKRTVLRSFHLNSGVNDVRNLLVYDGQLPSAMFLTLVNSGAYHGQKKNSPFNFKPYEIETAQAFRAGVPYPREKAFEMDFNSDHFNEVYLNFMNASGYGLNFTETNGITRNMFKYHSFFLAFDFRADDTTDNSVDLIKYGETRIFLKFNRVLINNTKIIAYLSFENLLRIDHNRNPIMDYST